jgi:hypothetical protein
MAKNYFGSPPGRRTSMQMKRKDQDSSGQGTKWMCSLCQISYYSEETPPQCPLCVSLRDVYELHRQLAEQEQRIETLSREVDRATANNDFVVAIRDAIDLISVEDMAWLKSILYRWREAKNITLKAVDTRQGPRGFLAVWRDGATEQHMVDSIGGVAIAGLYQEVTQGFGGQVAVMTLAKAFSAHLKGGL